MACLRFGTDALGKEILELVPATTAAATPAPANRNDTETTAPPPCSSSDARHQEDENARAKNEEEGDATQGSGAGDGAGLGESKPYKGENTIVMMEWERPYMRRLVDALGITEESDVLEIGFGCGYSADRIQELSPRSHTVVEPDPVVLERLRGWAHGRPGVVVVEGFWQTALATLGQFDAVFFDDFPLPGTPDSSDLRGPVSRWHAFIDLCVAHHLPIGGRITGYLARSLPLARPGCEVSPLVTFPVQVPENCPYFPYGEAYVPLITRVEEEGSDGTGRQRGTGAGTAGDGGRALGSFSLLEEARKREAEEGGEAAPGERKRRKRKALEALVRESLGL